VGLVPCFLFSYGAKFEVIVIVPAVASAGAVNVKMPS
jgi:hypothetical protein